MEPGRCSIHGLIVAEDGRCVICRRGDAQAGAEGPSKTISDSTWAVIVGGAVLIGICGYVLYKDPFSSKAKTIVDARVAHAPPKEDPLAAPPPAPRPHKPPVFITDQKPTSTPSAEPLSPEELDAKQAEQLEALKKQVQIKMYTKSDDAFSKRVRTYLEKRGYSFVEFDIDKSETDKILMKSLNPKGTVPTFDIEGHVLDGMDRDEFEDTMTTVAKAKLKQASR
jgi:glutaredoxin